MLDPEFPQVISSCLVDGEIQFLCNGEVLVDTPFSATAFRATVVHGQQGLVAGSERFTADLPPEMLDLRIRQ